MSGAAAEVSTERVGQHDKAGSESDILLESDENSFGERAQTYSGGSLRAYSPGNNFINSPGGVNSSLALNLGASAPEGLRTGRSQKSDAVAGRADLNQARFGRIHFKSNLRTCPFVVIAPDQNAHELLEMIIELWDLKPRLLLSFACSDDPFSEWGHREFAFWKEYMEDATVQRAALMDHKENEASNSEVIREARDLLADAKLFGWLLSLEKAELKQVLDAWLSCQRIKANELFDLFQLCRTQAPYVSQAMLEECLDTYRHFDVTVEVHLHGGMVKKYYTFDCHPESSVRSLQRRLKDESGILGLKVFHDGKELRKAFEQEALARAGINGRTTLVAIPEGGRDPSYKKATTARAMKKPEAVKAEILRTSWVWTKEWKNGRAKTKYNRGKDYILRKPLFYTHGNGESCDIFVTEMEKTVLKQYMDLRKVMLEQWKRRKKRKRSVIETNFREEDFLDSKATGGGVGGSSAGGNVADASVGIFGAMFGTSPRRGTVVAGNSGHAPIAGAGGAAVAPRRSSLLDEESDDLRVATEDELRLIFQNKCQGQREMKRKDFFDVMMRNDAAWRHISEDPITASLLQKNFKANENGQFEYEAYFIAMTEATIQTILFEIVSIFETFMEDHMSEEDVSYERAFRLAYEEMDLHPNVYDGSDGVTMSEILGLWKENSITANNVLDSSGNLSIDLEDDLCTYFEADHVETRLPFSIFYQKLVENDSIGVEQSNPCLGDLHSLQFPGVIFEVRAKSDVSVIFSGSGGEKLTFTFGAKMNGTSSIAINKARDPHPHSERKSTTGILSNLEFRTFWVSYWRATGRAQMGVGSSIGDNVLLTVLDPEPFVVEAVQVRSGEEGKTGGMAGNFAQVGDITLSSPAEWHDVKLCECDRIEAVASVFRSLYYGNSILLRGLTGTAIDRAASCIGQKAFLDVLEEFGCPLVGTSAVPIVQEDPMSAIEPENVLLSEVNSTIDASALSAWVSNKLMIQNDDFNNVGGREEEPITSVDEFGIPPLMTPRDEDSQDISAKDDRGTVGNPFAVDGEDDNDNAKDNRIDNTKDDSHDNDESVAAEEKDGDRLTRDMSASALGRKKMHVHNKSASAARLKMAVKQKRPGSADEEATRKKIESKKLEDYINALYDALGKYKANIYDALKLIDTESKAIQGYDALQTAITNYIKNLRRAMARGPATESFGIGLVQHEIQVTKREVWLSWLKNYQANRSIKARFGKLLTKYDLMETEAKGAAHVSEGGQTFRKYDEKDLLDDIEQLEILQNEAESGNCKVLSKIKVLLDKVEAQKFALFQFEGLKADLYRKSKEDFRAAQHLIESIYRMRKNAQVRGLKRLEAKICDLVSITAEEMRSMLQHYRMAEYSVYSEELCLSWSMLMLRFGLQMEQLLMWTKSALPKLFRVLEQLFVRGIARSANETSGWLFTRGVKEGFSKLVGQANEAFDHKITTVGINTLSSMVGGEKLQLEIPSCDNSASTKLSEAWGNSFEFLEKNSAAACKPFEWDPEDMGSQADQDMKKNCLDHNHNFFIFVDDVRATSSKAASPKKEKKQGQLDLFVKTNVDVDASIAFRSALEDAVASQIPNVMILANGGKRELKLAVESVRRKKATLIAIAGSGRAADAVSYHCVLCHEAKERIKKYDATCHGLKAQLEQKKRRLAELETLQGNEGTDQSTGLFGQLLALMSSPSRVDNMNELGGAKGRRLRVDIDQLSKRVAELQLWGTPALHRIEHKLISEIVNDGVVKIIDLGRKKAVVEGSSEDRNEETVAKIGLEIVNCLSFVRGKGSIEDRMRDSKQLQYAWNRYFLYSKNAGLQKWTERSYSYLGIFLSILATLLAILDAQYRVQLGDGFHQTMKNVIIVLPIVTGLTFSLKNKFTPGPKWLNLRYAAERIKSEIYQYRIGIGRYADEIKGTKIDRAAEMASALEQINEDLANSEVMASALIKPSRAETEGFWKGLVKDEVSITGKKDDDDEDEEMMSETTGFSQLLPEQYVEVRLKPQILFYQEKLPSTNQYFEVGQFLVYIFSAMGTFLASADAPMYVALTVSLTQSISSIMIAQRLEDKISKYNAALMQLEATLVWWESLSAIQKASPKDIRNLVIRTESIILNDISSWVVSMQASKTGTGDDEEEEEEEGDDQDKKKDKDKDKKKKDK